MDQQVTIVNLAEARYECTFGRGCDGHCCREGRPLVYPEEIERLDASLDRFLPRLRPEARATIQNRGYLTRRRRLGQRVMRTVGGACVFFRGGCVLHKAGEEEGDRFRYKPAVCALFPIQQDDHGRWYVRQKGHHGEKWNLWCLDPNATSVPAAASLHIEIALATRFSREAEATL
jgi:hypothetical protein